MPRLKIQFNRNRSILNSLYNRLFREGEGKVACFVCGKHVKYSNATLEHCIPKSKGGASCLGNYAISHFRCNVARGNDETIRFVKTGEKA